MITTDRSATAVRGKWSESDVRGIHVHWAGVPYSGRMGYRRRLQSFSAFAFLAAQRCARLRTDVVVASSTPLTVTLPGVWAARKHRVPMVLEVRDLWPEIPVALNVIRDPASRAAAHWLARFAYRNAAEVIALSPGMKAGVVAHGYPESHVTVIPNASDLDLFGVPPECGRLYRERHAWIGDRPLVVYAGALGRVNGVGYLVRVAAEMSRVDPEVRFFVLGEGPETEAVTALADRLSVLGTSLRISPRVPRSDMPAILSAATIVTSTVIDVPVLWHNSANKFFDGLAAGRPIAINYEGWQADLLRSSGAGIVLSANDHAEAASALASLLHDDERLSAARRASRSLAEDSSVGTRSLPSSRPS